MPEDWLYNQSTYSYRRNIADQTVFVERDGTGWRVRTGLHVWRTGFEKITAAMEWAEHEFGMDP